MGQEVYYAEAGQTYKGKVQEIRVIDSGIFYGLRAYNNFKNMIREDYLSEELADVKDELIKDAKSKYNKELKLIEKQKPIEIS